MTYEICNEPGSMKFDIGATTREDLFRGALCTLLEAVYGKPEGKPSGQVVLVQAAGATVDETLAGLLRATLLAIGETDGTLASPRWLSFDEARATANLPISRPRTTARPIEVDRVEVREAAGTAWAGTVHFRTP